MAVKGQPENGVEIGRTRRSRECKAARRKNRKPRERAGATRPPGVLRHVPGARRGILRAARDYRAGGRRVCEMCRLYITYCITSDAPATTPRPGLVRGSFAARWRLARGSLPLLRVRHLAQLLVVLEALAPPADTASQLVTPMQRHNRYEVQSEKLSVPHGLHAMVVAMRTVHIVRDVGALVGLIPRARATQDRKEQKHATCV